MNGVARLAGSVHHIDMNSHGEPQSGLDRTPRRRLRTTLATAMTVALTSLALVVLSPASPASASCSHAHSDRDTGSGYSTDPALRVRFGPHTSCGVLTYTPTTQLLYYECWDIGETIFGTNTWTYVHKSSDWNAAGWVLDYYLDDNGALTRC